ncbi:MAG: hypothetical protein ACD_7C00319G0011, partial [uncultured bacterium]
ENKTPSVLSDISPLSTPVRIISDGAGKRERVIIKKLKLNYEKFEKGG